VTHFLGQSEQVAHVGLGAAAQSRVATVQVTFLGGHVVTLDNVALNQELTVVEPDLPFPNAPGVVPAAAPDCDENGEEDACAPDCDGNRRPDSCDVRDGLVADCNANGVPDSCEISEWVRARLRREWVAGHVRPGWGARARLRWKRAPGRVRAGRTAVLDCNEDGVPWTRATRAAPTWAFEIWEWAAGMREHGHDARPGPRCESEGDAGGRRRRRRWRHGRRDAGPWKPRLGGLARVCGGRGPVDGARTTRLGVAPRRGPLAHAAPTRPTLVALVDKGEEGRGVRPRAGLPAGAGRTRAFVSSVRHALGHLPEVAATPPAPPAGPACRPRSAWR
jgi:hypothetical protein